MMVVPAPNILSTYQVSILYYSMPCAVRIAQQADSGVVPQRHGNLMSNALDADMHKH